MKEEIKRKNLFDNENIFKKIKYNNNNNYEDNKSFLIEEWCKKNYKREYTSSHFYNIINNNTPDEISKILLLINRLSNVLGKKSRIRSKNLFV